MWAMLVVVTRVSRQHGGQMAFTDDEHAVGAFAAYAADPALGECVRSGRLRRSLDHLDTFAGEHRVEGGNEFGVPVAEQKPRVGAGI
jgi:hypothetical protein